MKNIREGKKKNQRHLRKNNENTQSKVTGKTHDNTRKINDNLRNQERIKKPKEQQRKSLGTAAGKTK